MPAPVPPGYTRGPILFIGEPTHTPQDDAIYLSFWDEAGGFGARILLIAIGLPVPATFDVLRQRLQAWDCDRLAMLHLPDRLAARDPAHVTLVQDATAIALLSSTSRAIGPILGGTPTAQAIRRANARSKAVAGFGPTAAFLCQHMLLAAPGEPPAALQDTVVFAPGLGLINRLVVDTNAGDTPALRLLGAVANNPFVVAISLAPGSAAILYPDETLQAFGAPGVDLVDGADATAVDPDVPPSLSAVQGAHIVHLEQSDGFNLDERTQRPGVDIDLPPARPRTTL